MTVPGRLHRCIREHLQYERRSTLSNLSSKSPHRLTASWFQAWRKEISRSFSVSSLVGGRYQGQTFHPDETPCTSMGNGQGKIQPCRICPTWDHHISSTICPPGNSYPCHRRSRASNKHVTDMAWSGDVYQSQDVLAKTIFWLIDDFISRQLQG